MASLPSTKVVFKEDSKCKQCNATFGLMKRRHHCRVCGNSFCDVHSPKRTVAGQPTKVRLCNNCADAMSHPAPAKPAPKPKSTPAASGGAGSGAGAGAGASASASAPTPAPAPAPAGPPAWCTCGMPLCICDPPEPEPVEAPPKKKPPVASPTPAASAATSAARAARTGSSSGSPFTPFGFAAKTYTADIEGLRDAIKDGDTPSVRRIVNSDPVLAVQMDHGGQTMLHLAAMFKRREIAEILVDVGGADPTLKNCTGETVFQVAEPALQAWLRAHADADA